MTKHYRDAATGQYTTAEDAAARPGETVAEAVPERRESPDVAELRRALDDMRALATREGVYNGNRAVLDIIARAEPLLDDTDALRAELAHMAEARDNARAERDALGLRGDLLARDLGAAVVRADRAESERDALAADADKWQRAAQGDRDALTDERDSLSWQVEALRAERDARSSERDALAAKVERVWALHFGEYIEDEDRNRCFECGDDYPCPTARTLDEEPQP